MQLKIDFETNSIKEMVDISIQRIQQFEPPEGYYVAFSGGKDSIILLILMKTIRSVTDKEVVLNHPNINDVLIYDTETNSLDTSTAEVKFFGAYSYKYCKYFIFHKEEKQQIQKLIFFPNGRKHHPRKDF
jgi:predicted phosphoadenosine phosphosulfate sulfurtransferase